MKRDTTMSPLFTWRSAICDSGLPPTTRHVALTLSLHMSERGDSCFPSLATLTAETGLSKSTVAEHLNRLEEAGWLARQKGGGRLRDGERQGVSTRYTARVPEAFTTVSDDREPTEEPAGRELSGSRTVTPGGTSPTVRLTPINCPADTHQLSGSRTGGRHEDVTRSSSSAHEHEPDPAPADVEPDDDETALVKLVAAKVLARAAIDGREPRRGYGLRCAANLQPGGPDHAQVAELLELRRTRPGLSWELAADLVIGTATDPALTPAAAVISLEARQATSHVAGLCMTGALDEARHWITYDCPDSAREAAWAEYERRTGTRSSTA